MNGSFSKLKKLKAEAQAALDETQLGTGEALTRFQKVVHFWLLVARNFVANRCLVRASALAYTTLLALIPVLAVGLSFVTAFLKGPEGEKRITDLIQTGIDKIAPQLGLVAKSGSQGESHRVVDFITSSINNVSSGTLGLTAVVTLVFIGISLLANIETTLNDIWGVRRGRSWPQRIVVYWAAITLGPLLLMVALGINVSSHFDAVRDVVGETAVDTMGQLASGLLIVLTFGFFYKFMPNTSVNWRAALVGGTVGGVLFQLNNVFSAIYLGQVVRNSKIYGSLAVVPIFLVGLYFSWVILLFGAQVSYAFQNRKTYFQEKLAGSLNQQDREFLALRIMNFLAERFATGSRPPTTTELANGIGVPSKLAERILDPLLQHRLIVEVTGAECAYAPARPLAQITYNDILDAVRGKKQQLTTREDNARAQVQAELDKIRQTESGAAKSMTLDKRC